MDYPIVFWVAFIVSGAFTLLLGTAAVLYIRRAWHMLRAEEAGSIHERILDGLDHLETQVHLLGERMERLERRLPPPGAEAPDRRRAGGGDGDGRPGEGSSGPDEHPSTPSTAPGDPPQEGLGP